MSMKTKSFSFEGNIAANGAHQTAKDFVQFFLDSVPCVKLELIVADNELYYTCVLVSTVWSTDATAFQFDFTCNEVDSGSLKLKVTCGYVENGKFVVSTNKYTPALTLMLWDSSNTDTIYNAELDIVNGSIFTLKFIPPSGFDGTGMIFTKLKSLLWDVQSLSLGKLETGALGSGLPTTRSILHPEAGHVTLTRQYTLCEYNTIEKYFSEESELSCLFPCYPIDYKTTSDNTSRYTYFPCEIGAFTIGNQPVYLAYPIPDEAKTGYTDIYVGDKHVYYLFKERCVIIE